MTEVKRALLSVSDKRGLADFAAGLTRLGVDILSTGGTAALLAEHRIPAAEVAAYTGSPEIMGGRVKTLHPKIHGALLGRRGIDDAVMHEHGIAPIDLLVVNLYPFRETIARPGCSLRDALENIDIGGPAMLRAGAKNHATVAVVVDPDDYGRVLEELESSSGALSPELCFELAVKAFAHTAEYDNAISGYLHRHLPGRNIERLGDTLMVGLHKRADLRYGENPHQRGALYVGAVAAAATVVAAEQLQGKELSFNNIADADAALECVKQFYEPACVIVKHGNPCGVASDEDIPSAYLRAHAADPTSAFGGIIAVNRRLDAETAESVTGRQFVEVIVAPELAPEAGEILTLKPNVRVLATGWWEVEEASALDFRRVAGGFLVQDLDASLVDPRDLEVASRRTPSEHEVSDMLFAWKVAKFVKSNAIVFAKDRMTIGIGAGQMSRVYSARLAAMKAADHGLAVKGSVMASDAFLPFRDSVDAAAEHGVTAIIQPGGSRRDEEVIAAANDHGLAMVFTRVRHFKH